MQIVYKSTYFKPQDKRIIYKFEQRKRQLPTTTTIMTSEFYKHITCYIPRNLELTNIVGYNNRWHEKYIWFIHSIIFNDLTSKAKFGGYINLEQRLLQKYLGTRYTNKIIKQLVENKIVEVNGKYSAGAFSRSYRLTEKYRSAKLNSEKITKQSYCRKIAMMQSEYIATAVKESALVQYELMQCTYARIDKDKALDYIKENYIHNSPHYKSRLIAIEQYDAMHKASFTNGSWSDVGFTFKLNKGRIYSPCTMLARDLEQFTYFHNYDEVKVVSMDMPNSQLCFFNELLKREELKVHNIGEESRENIDSIDMNNTYVNSKITSLYPPHIPSPYVMHFGTSWEDYIFNGLGYERMMFLTEWCGKKQDHTKEERREFKGEFFGQLFYNRYSDRLTDMEMVFMAHHEKEAKLLREAKKRKGNKLLAVDVQRLEAKFFHTVVVDYMKRNHKSVPFTIKHDSIAMPMTEASHILQDLNKLVTEFFGRESLELKADIL